MNESYDPNMAVKVGASYLGVSLTVMYALCSDPSFYPAFRIPGTTKILINRNDLDRWIAEQQKATSEENKRFHGKHNLSRKTRELITNDCK